MIRSRAVFFICAIVLLFVGDVQLCASEHQNWYVNFYQNYGKRLALPVGGLGLAYVAYKAENPKIKYPAAFASATAFMYPFLKNLWQKFYPSSVVVTPFADLELRASLSGSEPSESSWLGLLKSAQSFIRMIQRKNFPVINNMIFSIAGDDKVKQNRIVEQAAGVRPIVHEKVKQLILDFIDVKRNSGSNVEKAFYNTMWQEAKEDNLFLVNNFIKRLLVCRPLAFVGKSDDYLLRDGKTDGANDSASEYKPGPFDSIGTDDEKAPLVLKDYISYDEMAISALIGVSCPTYFINNGNRENWGGLGKKGDFQEEGVFVGLVGARFERIDSNSRSGSEQFNRMETCHMAITSLQNTSANGYGKGLEVESKPQTLLQVWQKFYGKTFPTYEMAKSEALKYIKVGDDRYLDVEVYKKRIKMVIEPFLLDADERARSENKKAYCFIVGLGLGVWKLDNIYQKNIYIKAVAEAVRDSHLPDVSDIDLSWIDTSENQEGTEAKEFILNVCSKKNINVQFTKNNPAQKLKDPGKLLVAMYAWDSNAYPGNEYWKDSLNASGDPAAACCSTIQELQNPLINHQFLDKITFYGSADEGQQAIGDGERENENDKGKEEADDQLL